MSKMNELSLHIEQQREPRIENDPVYGQQYDDGAYFDYFANLTKEKAREEKVLLEQLERLDRVALSFGGELESKAETKGTRYNSGKLRLSLLSPVASAGTTRVLMYGCAKYDAHNWRKGLNTEEILESMQRHLSLFLAGEECDEESGLPHVDHIACNAMFLQEQYYTGRGTDNRWKDPATLTALKQLLAPKKEGL